MKGSVERKISFSPFVEYDQFVLDNALVMGVEHIVVQCVRIVESTVGSAGVRREGRWEFHEATRDGFNRVLQGVGCGAIKAVVCCQTHRVDSGFCVVVYRVLVCAELAVAEIPEEFIGIHVRQVDKIHGLARYDDRSRAVHEGCRSRREHFHSAVVHHLVLLALEANDRQRYVVHTGAGEDVRGGFFRRHYIVVKVPDVLCTVVGVVFEVHSQRSTSARTAGETGHWVG